MIRLRPSGADEVLIKRVRDWYEPGPGVFIAPQALFNPALLFTAGVNGVWYDPSDLNTLFQDAAGTTPVTAVEQPVGLMLDKSKGLVLGSELVTNGDFSNGTTGWTTPITGASITDQVLAFDGVNSITNGAVITTNTPTTSIVAGRSYKVTYSIINSITIGVSVNVGGGLGTIRTAAGTYTEIITAINTSAPLVMARAGNGARTGSIDNISVRELPGNHAFNSSGNSANFPVLSARYNLLTKTEEFDDAVWTKAQSTVSADSSIAPNGTQTADKLIENTAVGGSYFVQQSVVGSAHTTSIYAKAAGRSKIAIFYTVHNSHAVFDLDSGTVFFTSGAITASIQDVGGGWHRCVASTTLTTHNSIRFYLADASGNLAYNGNGTNGAYLWGADLRVTNDALNQPAYQRVNTSTDYDTVGFKPYLKFNGTNQWLQTNSIDFTYGDKMFVCAGVRKLSDAAVGIVLETSITSTSLSGTFSLQAPPSVVNTYRYGAWATGSGSGRVDATSSATYASPTSNVLSGISDISTPSVVLRVNGSQSAQNTSTQGSGTYGNYPLYIGARAGSSLWFNGRLHQLVVAGKQASASEIGQTEAFTNKKTGAY